jgi:hypothetical protein
VVREEKETDLFEVERIDRQRASKLNIEKKNSNSH